jgi:HPt (histidine-containing phosphotransfer) domain-containing protein
MEASSSSHEREAAIARALDAMWQKFLPDVRERAEVLGAAAEAAAAGTLTDEHRAAAQSVAHKLAGTLGTFGLNRGTALARELEMRFSGAAIAQDEARELVRTAAEIRSIIEGRESDHAVTALPR